MDQSEYVFRKVDVGITRHVMHTFTLYSIKEIGK